MLDAVGAPWSNDVSAHAGDGWRKHLSPPAEMTSIDNQEDSPFAQSPLPSTRRDFRTQNQVLVSWNDPRSAP